MKAPALLTGGLETLEYGHLPHFDWYQGTMDQDAILHPLELFGVLGDVAPRPIPGVNGYSRGWEILKENETLVRVYEGNGKDPHFISTGCHAGTIASTVRNSGRNNHRVSRADVAIDLVNGPDFYAELERDLIEMFPHITQRSIVSKPVKGPTASTLYLGSSNSALSARIYEKGKEDQSFHPDTVRVEIQCRPNSRDKSAASKLEPVDYFGQARWTNRLLEKCLGFKAVAAPPRPLRVSTLEGSLNACCHQYGGRLEQYLVEECGGDIDRFIYELTSRFPSNVSPK